MTSTIRSAVFPVLRVGAAAALLALAGLGGAQAQDGKKDLPPADVKYHAAPSALAGTPMVDSRNPKAQIGRAHV